MSELYKTISALCEQNNISGYKLCKEIKISPSVLTDLKMGRKKSLSADYAERIASYFGVSVSYLLGTETTKDPADEGEVSEDAIKFALAGDAGRILTDDDMEKIRAFAAWTAQERSKKDE